MMATNKSTMGEINKPPGIKSRNRLIAAKTIGTLDIIKIEENLSLNNFQASFKRTLTVEIFN